MLFNSIEIYRHTPAEPWTFEKLLRRQSEVIQRVEMGENGRILLSELAPVVTLGRREVRENLLLSEKELGEKGVTVAEATRGGLATYHGPGQWVLFFVEKLEKITGDSKGVRRAVDLLLNAALSVAKEYEPEAFIREGDHLGVWCSRGKLASVGVHVQNGILTHGVSLNCEKTPLSFIGIKPCGLDEPVAFLFDSQRANSAGRDFLMVGQLLAQRLLTSVKAQGYT